MESLLWERVGELADQAPRISDLRHHKLQLIAASRMRARRVEVPEELRRAERHAAAIALSATPLIRRVRAATDRPMIVMKGPEAAALWPSPRLRPWKDLDLLVEDAEAFQAELLAAGFVEIGDPVDYEDSHHLRPVAHPAVPVSVEVHRRPKWPTRRTPAFDEIAAEAVPSVLDVPGVLAPSAAHHAVLMAGHAWEHDPLSRVGLLADIAAIALEADPDDIDAAARAWGVSRIWSVTESAIDRLLLDRRRASRSRIWHRHLYETRERTVFEGHIERLVGPVAAAPVTVAPVVATRAIWNTLRPGPDETWTQKLRRSRRSVHHASLRESEHHQHTVGRTDS